MHSIYSIDGELQPKEVVKKAVAEGVTFLSLTDHNSVRGVKEARIAAREQGIFFVTGVELDSTFKGSNLHILGYGIHEDQTEFQDIEQQILKQERYAGGVRLELIRQCNIFVDGAWVCDHAINGVITGELIGESAMACSENEGKALLEPYRPGGSRSDNPFLNFYLDYCAPGKTAYVPIRYRSTAEIISLIHKSGGVAVIAHPELSIGRNEGIIKELVDLGLDGIEVFSSYHDENTTEFYQKIAEKYHLLMTCGSDYHGKTKPSILPGSVSFDQCYDLVENLALTLLSKY